MVSQRMKRLGEKRSTIREIFEYSKKRKAEIGADKVFDFSIGNPSVPAPKEVTDVLLDLIESTPAEALHAYTSAQGDMGVRTAIAEYTSKTHGASVSPDLIYLTCGAAAALSIAINAVACDKDDEIIIMPPFFPEYRVFIENAGCKAVEVPLTQDDFQIDTEALKAKISNRTRAVIINSPNNPSGAVLTEASIKALANTLRECERTVGHPIYLIADEPYRELVYDGVAVPYITNYYNNSMVCYSFSKSLSLPGERIGYVLVNPVAEEAQSLYFAIMGAGRALGYVCAGSLFQYMIPRCLGLTSDISVYKKNRDILYSALTEYGYTCVKPDGAFYMFVKALEEDAYAFCERAKKHELLLVPSDDFGYPGYVRVAYCTDTDMIERSLSAFEKLTKEYK